jgi:hypothetical protein
MLFVVVIEFFICWTPLYVINTIALFNPKAIYQDLGYTAISFMHLLSFSSSCCNPITYCFMNIGFRKAFMNLFPCFRHETGRRISVSGYCATSVHSASAEAQILAATVNSIMNNGEMPINLTTIKNDEDENNESFLFQENPMNCHSKEMTSSSNGETTIISTQFNN